MIRFRIKGWFDRNRVQRKQSRSDYNRYVLIKYTHQPNFFNSSHFLTLVHIMGRINTDRVIKLHMHFNPIWFGSSRIVGFIISKLKDFIPRIVVRLRTNHYFLQILPSTFPLNINSSIHWFTKSVHLPLLNYRYFLEWQENLENLLKMIFITNTLFVVKW
jgi:hypothetical protein